MDKLCQLLAGKHTDIEEWKVRGFRPKHYKRISVDEEEALRLARIGATQIWGFFGQNLFFSQALIAGAALSGDYDDIVIVTPSQYGKSWLMGRIALLMAFRGRGVYLAGATADTTHIIMRHVIESGVTEAVDSIADLIDDEFTQDTLERLGKSASKHRIAMTGRGFVETITLGDTFGSLAKNKAVGRGGDFIIDEAALVSEESLAELGRREFANIDGSKGLSIMISNPHRHGYFYDKLTQENPNERTFILWMDALTAIEEGRFTEKQVLESEFAKHTSTLTRYLLCELESHGFSMFDEPLVEDMDIQGITTLGVDAAYKGKDKITLARAIMNDEGFIYIPEIVEVDKQVWVDGHTSQEVIDAITRVYHYYKVPMMCVDTGQGIWLNEGLKQKGLNTIGIGFGEGTTEERKKANQYTATNGKNMRAEMHLDLQDLIAKKGIAFSEQAYNQIKNVLPLVSMERKSGNKIQIRPKPEITQELGHSPDAFDALLLAVHAAIIYNAENYGY